MLIYLAGLKRSELLNLKVIDIDSERMIYKYQRSEGDEG
jgi:integrase